jgi:hypothetical protein
MSYDFWLEKNGKTCEVPNHIEGGTYAIGGTTEASLNVTYNYSCFYYWFLDKEQGLKWLVGKKAKDTIVRLDKAVHILTEEAGFGGNVYEKDYWACTPGNAGHALKILLSWAKLHPEAIWCGGY